MNKSILSLLVLLNFSTAVSAKPAHDDAAPASDSFVFQLLPNSLSKNPRLHLSYVTEMSEAGRKLPPPSPEKPTYYQAKDGGYRQMGEGSSGKHVPPPGDIENLMMKALTKAGYQEADTAHPAALIIVFQWGAYATPTESPDSPPVSVGIKNRQLLERAALVGGEKYARALEAAIVEASLVQDTKATLRTDDTAPGGTATENVFGITTGSFSDISNPIKIFLGKSPKNQELFDLAADSCYYVIATAYDKAAYLEKKQFLALWRTKMCVAADGVSLADTVQPMIARSSYFLGKETDGAVTISRRLREGRVDLGELKIMGEVEQPAKPGSKK